MKKMKFIFSILLFVFLTACSQGTSNDNKNIDPISAKSLATPEGQLGLKIFKIQPSLNDQDIFGLWQGTLSNSEITDKNGKKWISIVTLRLFIENDRFNIGVKCDFYDQTILTKTMFVGQSQKATVNTAEQKINLSNSFSSYTEDGEFSCNVRTSVATTKYSFGSITNELCFGEYDYPNCWKLNRVQ